MFLRSIIVSGFVAVFLNFAQTEISNIFPANEYGDHDVEKRALGDCGGTFYSDYGEFSSPGYPGYYNNKQECIYVIFIPRNDALIAVDFVAFNTEPMHDVVSVYNGLSLTGTLIDEYSGTSVPNRIISTGNVLTVTFTSDFSATRPGFLANYTAYSKENENCSRTIISDTGSISWRDWYTYETTDCYLRLIVSEGYKAQIDMYVPCCYDYHIEVFDGLSESDSLLKDLHYFNGYIRVTSTGRSLYVHLYPSSSYASSVSVSYRAVTHGSNEIDYYYWTSTFWWNEPVVTEAPMTTWWWWWEYTTNPNDYALGNCGGNFTSDSSSFASPSYPGVYPDQQDCYYIITVSEDNAIALDFTLFDTEVCCDFVEIFDGDSKFAASSLGRYYGSKIDSGITSSGQSLFVHFHSDHSKNHKGFFATYSLVKEVQTSNLGIVIGGAAGAGAAVLIAVIAIIVACYLCKKKPPAPPMPREVQSMRIGGSTPNIQDTDEEDEMDLGSIGRGHNNKGYLNGQGQPPPYGQSSLPGTIDNVP